MRLPFFAFVLFAAWSPLRGDSGDVAGSRDYPGFTRLPGFVITEYHDDNPAAFSFPVTRPQPTDAGHIETASVTGHRYIIHYAPGPDAAAPSLFQVQDYYEKLAAGLRFVTEKSGAVGDVTETFHRSEAGHDLWVYLEPGADVDVLTVVEADGAAPQVTSSPAPAGEDPLYAQLMQNGHAVLPVSFLPSKPELDGDAQPAIDRVVRLMQKHPGLQLSIEGHTDDSGLPEDNRHLSEARARTTRDRLIAGGVEPSRLTFLGLGGDNPVASNNTAQGREQNRRIELVLFKK